jgi:hypothetical protein
VDGDGWSDRDRGKAGRRVHTLYDSLTTSNILLLIKEKLYGQKVTSVLPFSKFDCRVIYFLLSHSFYTERVQCTRQLTNLWTLFLL